jgi:hypothetical protein
MTRLVALLAASASVAVLVGCTDATGSLRGGEPVELDPCQVNPGPTWTYLYGCYFGPTGKAACSGAGTCHSSQQDLGGSTGFPGFVCGESQSTCYEGFTSFDSQITVPPGPPEPPKESASLVLSQLRHLDNGALLGTMPCSGAPMSAADCLEGNGYVFTSDDLALIQAWINAGVPNN